MFLSYLANLEQKSIDSPISLFEKKPSLISPYSTKQFDLTSTFQFCKTSSWSFTLSTYRYCSSANRDNKSVKNHRIPRHRLSLLFIIDTIQKKKRELLFSSWLPLDLNQVEPFFPRFIILNVLRRKKKDRK